MKKSTFKEVTHNKTVTEKILVIELSLEEAALLTRILDHTNPINSLLNNRADMVLHTIFNELLSSINYSSIRNNDDIRNGQLLVGMNDTLKEAKFYD